MLINAGALPGDALILTKPLELGIRKLDEKPSPATKWNSAQYFLDDLSSLLTDEQKAKTWCARPK